MAMHSPFVRSFSSWISLITSHMNRMYTCTTYNIYVSSCYRHNVFSISHVSLVSLPFCRTYILISFKMFWFILFLTVPNCLLFWFRKFCVVCVYCTGYCLLPWHLVCVCVMHLSTPWLQWQHCFFNLLWSLYRKLYWRFFLNKTPNKH